ncbi:MAG: apolipoprotein N-acyltransferase, partial [Leptospiraceae bacterium]|nr:apolipoprotein N-acyltransferase [Leptospiraceae bacterium]
LLMMAVARYIYSGNILLMLFTAWLFSLSFQLFAFFWIPGTIQTYAGASREASTVYALVYSFLYQSRILLLFAGFYFSFRLPRYGVWLVGLAALLGDLFSPQVFNWYWGNMAEGWLWFRQLAALAGVYGVGLIFLMLVRLSYDALPEAMAHAGKRWSGLERPGAYLKAPHSISHSAEEVPDVGPRSAWIAWKKTVILSALLAAILLHGWWNLYRVEESIKRAEDGSRLRVAMLQTATSRKMLGSITDYDHAATAMNRVINQSLEVVYRSGASLDLIILPESAIPYHGTSPADTQVYSVTMHALISYLSGVSRAPILFNQLSQDRQKSELTYNTATLWDPASGGTQSYRKRLLIPFGEYLPLEGTFPLLRKFFPGAGHYSPEQADQPLTMKMAYFADRPHVRLLDPGRAGIAEPEKVWTSPGDAIRAGIEVYHRSYGQIADSSTASPSVGSGANGLPDWMESSQRKDFEFSLLICYEDLIPDLSLAAFEKKSPDFIVNISNDSWLSDERAMQQHYSAARFRAIESGRFLLRSTLTGVSGIMDPAGRDFVEPSQVNVRGTMVERVPVAGHVQTLYTWLGPATHWIMIFLLLLPVAFFRIQALAKR